MIPIRLLLAIKMPKLPRKIRGRRLKSDLLEKNWTEKNMNKTINQKELMPSTDMSPQAIRWPMVPHQLYADEYEAASGALLQFRERGRDLQQH